jgi:tungstate transport system substrate-binding protein
VNYRKRLFVRFAVVALAVVACGTSDSTPEPTIPEPTAASAQSSDVQRLVLATTTSTEDSGLLDFILPDFEAQFNARVDVVAVGTGQALALGENGDADVLLVHARAREDAFVADGNGTARYDVMYNDFVILGPADDPAWISGMKGDEGETIPQGRVAVARFEELIHQGHLRDSTAIAALYLTQDFLAREMS